MFMPLPPIGGGNDGVIKKRFEIMDFYNPNREVSRIENAPEETAGRTKLKDSEYLCLRKALAELKGMRIGISAPVVIILSAIMLIKLCRIGSLCLKIARSCISFG